MQRLQTEKKSFLLTEPPPHTENFAPVAKKWIRPMLRMFVKGISERGTHDPEVDPPFVDATLGGHVTFVKFAEIMDHEL
jgi:5-formyltetrahydrofolate cyclo-ligase